MFSKRRCFRKFFSEIPASLESGRKAKTPAARTTAKATCLGKDRRINNRRNHARENRKILATDETRIFTDQGRSWQKNGGKK
jgi:hypothetical protein